MEIIYIMFDAIIVTRKLTLKMCWISLHALTHCGHANAIFNQKGKIHSYSNIIHVYSH